MLGKIITEMVTPFDQFDNLNYETLKHLIYHLIKNNVSSLVVGGLTGEEPNLQEVEKRILIEKTLEYVKERVPVIVSVLSNSTLKTINYINKIEYLNIDAYSVVVPYYNQPDQEGLLTHFTKVANSTRKPIIIHNNPTRAGVDLNLESIIELSKNENIVGLVESNLSKIKQLKTKLKDFKVYVGEEPLFYDGIKIGADGVYSIASNIYGNSIHHIFQLLRKNQVDDAFALFELYKPKFNALLKKPSPVTIKAALKRLAIDCGGVRLPLVDMKPEEKQALYKILGV